ncbi:hypothetical protein BM221_000894 [Beauveria bassiana]|uniref:Uncharacterized protein n=1 Tax=Beauveria bassiana TaxID=176275 RepID=A0A2N6P1R7_BEABA|nr:hypothetical protein BM221_000894 [Beauveria bassiana]
MKVARAKLLDKKSELRPVNPTKGQQSQNDQSTTFMLLDTFEHICMRIPSGRSYSVDDGADVVKARDSHELHDYFDVSVDFDQLIVQRLEAIRESNCCTAC